MMRNTDIYNLKTFKFKVNMKLKASPHLNRKLKELCISEIDKIRLPMSDYYMWSDITNFSTFIGKCVARLDSCLSDNNVNRATIDKVKDDITKLRL